MIKITILYNCDNVTAIECVGHSGYAESGSDIVCASVSVLVQNAQKTFEEELSILLKLFQNVEEKGILLNLFYESSITLNQNQTHKHRENYSQISLMNTETESLQKKKI